MKRARNPVESAAAWLLVACWLFGCSDAPNAASSSSAAAPADNGGAAPVAGGSAGSSAPSGEPPASGGGPNGGAGQSTSGGTDGAGASTGGGASGGDSSSAGAAASGGGAAIPPPVAESMVWGFGLGVSDVPAATDFYRRVMKMTVEKDAAKREDRTETTLYATQAKRGARLTLMGFNDQRNTRNITAKLVWQSRDVSDVTAAASKFPWYVSRLSPPIAQFDGPDTYIHEVGGIFDNGGGAIAVPYPIALGFAVSDQTAATKFYTALGMKSTRLGSFRVTDATGTGTITEYTVKFATGSGVVLQKWSPPRNATNNPVKIVVMVPDAKAMADKVVAAGGKLVTAATRSEAHDGRLLIVAQDLDGYLLELVQ